MDNATESGKTLALIFDHSPVPMWVFDRETLRFLAVNPSALRGYGYTREEFLAMDVLGVRPEEATLEFLHSVRSRMDSIQTGVACHRAKDGTVFDVKTVECAIVFDGHPAILSISQNTSEQEKAYQALQRSEEHYRTLFETMTQGVVYHDANGNMLASNPAAERILGLNAAQIGAGPAEDTRHRIVHEDGTPFPYEEQPAFVALRSGQPVHDVVMGVHYPESRELRWLLINAMPLYQPGAQCPYQVCTTFEDITVRKEFAHLLEQRVHERTIELQQANRAKDEFLANMSHELRTPLHGILAFTEMLLEETYAPVNEQQREALQTIEASSQHLLQLINDVLDLAKLDAKMLELLPDEVVVTDVCHSSLAFVKEPAQRKQITVTLKSDPNIMITADPRRLKQILVNLLSNAVKFTQPGGHVSLETKADPQTRTIEFIVQDTGIGIEPAELEHIFEPFVQVDSTLARRHEGTGLGLRLVRQLVHMHGGTVSVRSVVGEGSCFTVSLPWKVPVDEALSEPVAAIPDEHSDDAQQPALILLAEDNEITVTVMTAHLERQGYQVVVAHDGLDVIKLAEATNPSLILMDIQMPNLDGLEATRRLRSNPRFAATPIIALTALAMAGDRDRCLAAGASDYASKPISLKNVTELLRKHLAPAS